MSSSGLIYAVIVGAWAAYLVPMWLRRQDELNESRPTERFSTAIRLLAGRSALERRASRSLTDESDGGDPAPAGDDAPGDASDSGVPASAEGVPDGPDGPDGPEPAVAESEDVPADPVAPEIRVSGADPAADRPVHRPTAQRRARLLARRRRMVTLLFVAFALGAVVAAVAGFAFIWVPALPAVLLTFYIGHLRRLERQRYEVKLDRVRAAQAAERLRAREREREQVRAGVPEPAAAPAAVRAADEPARPHLRLAADPPAHGLSETASSATALAEATDHEEWVDGMRERGPAGADSWEPVPVPLPTYVTAPVAPRVTRGLDLAAPGVRDSGRPSESRRTPLFDQYAESTAPPEADCAPRARAANE
ncbi:gephyrin-like molybdotransferase receptor GlpR, partial [Streptomyces sp. NRRL B-24484]|uniref:divisome protein SepX/GlpR n=1 Tax=Streptomyces sp. NRRL B-24484 TaxID=1463833 RepID=UPI0004C275B4